MQGATENLDALSSGHASEDDGSRPHKDGYRILKGYCARLGL